MKSILGFIAILLLAAQAGATGVEGYWKGTALRGSEPTEVSLHVEREDGGLVAHYSLPRLSLAGIPVAKFAFDPATGMITSSRGFNGRQVGNRITGELYPALLHGAPVSVELTRSGTLPTVHASERPVEFRSRGFLLKGWLVAPRSNARVPALVSLHGSGPSTRWLALARARRFAEAGYAMLIFDKPGSGESQGDWTMTSLDEMAEDALAALEFVRSQKEVDPGRVGLWAHSQAGWIVSRAAAMPNNIAFAIVLAGGGASPREVEEFGYLNRLRHSSAGPADVSKAMDWVRAYLDYTATGQGYDAVVRRLRDAADQDWTKALGVRQVYPTLEQQPKWQWVASYDPARDIRRIRFPVLLLFADKDENSPSQRSLALWRSGLAAAGNRRVEWKIFADAEHHFLTPPKTDTWPTLVPGFYETQIDWLRRTAGP